MVKITVDQVPQEGVDQYAIKADTSYGTITGDYFPSPDQLKATYILPGFSADKSSFMTPVTTLKEKNIGSIVMNLNGQGTAGGRFNGKEIVETTKEIMPAIRSELGLQQMGSFGASTGGIAVMHEGAQQNSASDAVMTISAPMILEDCKGTDFIKGLAALGPYAGHALFKFFNSAYALVQTATNKHYREKYASYFFKSLLSTASHIGATKVENVVDLAQGFKDAPHLFTQSTYGIQKPLMMIWGTNDKVTGAHKEAYREQIHTHADNITAHQTRGKVIFESGASHTMNHKDTLGKMFCSDGSHDGISELVQYFFREHLK